MKLARGDFHGEETLVLESGRLRVEALAAAGPRIVRLALAGANILGEVPDIGWDTPWGRFNLRGGHRLWVAPENPPLTSPPDEGDLAVTELGERSLRLERLEPESGLMKTMEIELARDEAALKVRHSVRNESGRTIVRAPWPITILPPGGTAILPQQRGPIGRNDYLPNRALTFWPYSSVTDARLVLDDELVLVRGGAAPEPFKIGYLNRAGWTGYLRAGILFCKRCEPQPGRKHADLDCNVEVYTNDRLLELETLGPLARLRPGDEAALEERWELHRLAASAEPTAGAIAGSLAELGLL